ncbi:hypothetical protein O6H91_08G063600 [Diphasiastrum complanatum]|uniref:Uncharacterized protein n=1 Tax=Diphasiastrum complanatum TaxID=34168 RepID=A0ACC2CYE6_DIPCM|nr:hypothetical protein O6H91_08G063600 [Diphasiastrum complanatum]
MGYESKVTPKKMQISIPSYFRCPISSDLMKDPVTLCTGNTYDRESIQRWLGDGNNFCPVTMKNLETQELIPNHNLRRLIQAWCVANQSEGVERIPTPKQPLERPQVDLLLRDIVSPKRRLQAFEDLKSKAKESEENRRRIVEGGAVNVLASIVASNNPETRDFNYSACEEAVGTLALLPIDENDRKMLTQSKLLSVLSLVLCTGSLQGKRNVASLLEILATNRDECIVIGSVEGLIGSLVQLLEEDLHRTAVKTCLRSLLAICSPLRNRVKTVEAGAVKLLVELLPEAERGTAELTLAVLELLCRCAEGRVAVSEHALAIPVLARKIFRVSDLATDSAVVTLWAICKYSPDKKIQRRVIESGVLSKLFFFVQTDYKSRIKLKAADLLRILHNACRDQVAA